MPNEIDSAAFRNLANDFGSGFSNRGAKPSWRDLGVARSIGDSFISRGGETHGRTGNPRDSERKTDAAGTREDKNRKMRKTDYKGIKKEAKAELKSVRNSATKVYEKTLTEAKARYLKNAERFRLEYNVAKDEARQDYEKALEFAQHDYEFTVDIAKDQYKTEKAESPSPKDAASPDRGPGWFEMDSDSPGLPRTADGAPAGHGDAGKPIMRLEDEIRQIVEESVSEWGPEYQQLGNSEESW